MAESFGFVEAFTFVAQLPVDLRELVALGSTDRANEWSREEWALYAGYLGAALIEQLERNEGKRDGA